MNNRHKYFRNLRYKQKLEAEYDNGNRNIYFITKKPDPRELRRWNHKPYIQESYLNKLQAMITISVGSALKCLIVLWSGKKNMAIRNFVRSTPIVL